MLKNIPSISIKVDAEYGSPGSEQVMEEANE
jgi:hypothetical protein